MPINMVRIYRLQSVCFFVIFVCVCMVKDFSTEDKVSGVVCCTVVDRRPGQGISHFGELCSPRSSQKPKIELIGQRAQSL